MKRTCLAGISTLLLATGVVAGAQSNVPVVSTRLCTHGLVPQPSGGPFSLFVFCDDALAVNIGVILTERGAGPGKIELGPLKTWTWDTTGRFWQDAEWSADVGEFVWSPSLRYLYVATNPIYGTGHLYELDLLNKTVSDFCSQCDDADILGVENASRSLEVRLTVGTRSETRSFPLR